MNSQLSPHQYQMAHYDALPPKIRNFLANAKMNYAAHHVFDLVLHGSEAETLKVLHAEEKKYARR